MTNPVRALFLAGSCCACACGAVVAQTTRTTATTTTTDALVAEYLAAGPVELARLEQRVGGWQIASVAHYTTFIPGDPPTVRRAQTIKETLIFSGPHGGVRSDSIAAIADGSPARQADSSFEVSNPEYSFAVDSVGDRPGVLTRFAESKRDTEPGKDWSTRVLGSGGLTAVEMDGLNLIDALRSGVALRVTGASVVDRGGGRQVRFDFDRHFPSKSAPVSLPGWVIVSPADHWAIVEYEQQSVYGKRRTTVEYNKEVADVAVPSSRTVEDFNADGQLLSRLVMSDSRPTVVDAPAEAFTLASFGLQRPRQFARVAEGPSAKWPYAIGFAILLTVVVVIVTSALRRRDGGGGSSTKADG